jgi:hypothetical protein
MHALLCRSWRNRVKGRESYDFVWYVGRGIRLDLAHLEQRMLQSGHYEGWHYEGWHYEGSAPISEKILHELLRKKTDLRKDCTFPASSASLSNTTALASTKAP